MNQVCRMKKVMISQPMAGKSDKEIGIVRKRAIKRLESLGYHVINTLFTEEWCEWCSRDSMFKRGVTNVSLCFLAKSLDQMSLCDAVYFCRGWRDARGCRVEHQAAEEYGLNIIEED